MGNTNLKIIKTFVTEMNGIRTRSPYSVKVFDSTFNKVSTPPVGVTKGLSFKFD